MVVKGGKRNEKETVSFGKSGKRKKKQKGGNEERKWRYNWSLKGSAETLVKGGKRNEKETASLGRLGKRKRTEKGE